MEMLPVDKRSQVLANLLVLNNGCHSEDPETRTAAISLLVRGKVFVVENIGGKLIYGPSRFVGYNGNTILAHGNNEGKYGGETNNALSRLYGPEIVDSELTANYYDFLTVNGLERNQGLQTDLKFFCIRESLLRKPNCYFFSPTHLAGKKRPAWNSFFENRIAAIGWESVDYTHRDFQYVTEELKRQNPDNLNAAIEAFGFMFKIQPGDIVVTNNASHGIFGIGVALSGYKFSEGIHHCDGDENSDEYYSHYIDVAWLTNSYVKKTNIANRNESLWEPFGAMSYKATVPNYLLQILFPYLNENPQLMENELPTIVLDCSINTIYYGPPGTGKTFKLNQLRKDHFTDQNAAKTLEEHLRERVAKYPFWQILAAVLGSTDKPVSVPELTENPLVLAKRNPENTTTLGSILWRVLPQYSDDSSTKVSEKYRSGIPLFNKKEKSRWTLGEGVREELETILAPDLIQLAKNPVLTQAETSGEVRRYKFITFHQKYGYEDFMEGIKPVLRNEESEEQGGDLQFELKKGIFYNSCMEALKLAGYQSFEECKKDTPENRELKFKAASENPKQCFALFIDEINRANISAVFGELITLLEDDKRIGAKQEMWLTLPGSGKLFGVPSNLYLIGTMNTADRSIALVDIALRRRFEFKGLYPEYPENSWWGPMLKSINQKIHDERKGADFFIGHAFFIDKEEAEKTGIFNHKIIPLLLEYFQNNLDKVQSILKGSGIETKDLTIENNYQIVAK